MGNICIKSGRTDMVDSATIKEHQTSLSKKKLGQNIVHAEFHSDINAFFDLTDGEELGRGISGSVSTVRHKDTGIVFACKTLDKMMVSENELTALKQEIASSASEHFSLTPEYVGP